MMALAWSQGGDGAEAAALEAEGRSAPVLLARSIVEAVDFAMETACAGATDAPGSPEARVAVAAATTTAAAPTDALAPGGTAPAPA